VCRVENDKGVNGIPIEWCKKICLELHLGRYRCAYNPHTKTDVILPDAVSNKGERPGKGRSIKVSNVGIKMHRQLCVVFPMCV
jgi:hypothetical protein